MEYNKLKEIFSIQNILIYLVIINFITFIAMGIDKRKAQKGRWRISEHALFVLVLLGGGIGGIIGMYHFRHKTKKPKFYIGFPAIAVLEIIALTFALIKLYSI